VPSTWSIDLHYPKKQYAQKFPDNPFISYAVHGKGVDRSYGYPFPTVASIPETLKTCLWQDVVSA
jgi:hypothetical protein